MAAPRRRERRDPIRQTAPRRPQPPLPRRKPSYTVGPRPVRHSPLPTSGSLPWPTRLLLLAGLVVLVAVIVSAGSGALGRAAGSFVGNVGGLVGDLVPTAATPSPTPVPALVPRLDKPRERYTREQTYTIVGHLPTGFRGTPDASVRIYDNGKFVVAVAVSTTTDFVVPDVPLVEGDNELTAAIALPGEEGEPSDAISIIRDDKAPTIKLTSPKDGLEVTAATVRVAGTTEAGSAVTIHNVSSGGSTTVIVDDKGAFRVDVTLIDGQNELSVTVTDPAGNSGQKTVTVTRKAGGVTATLTLSSKTVAGDGQGSLSMTATIKDDKGRAVSGGTATFIVTPPNQGALVSQPQDIAGGVARWSVTLARDPLGGSGQVVVNVQLPDGRSTTTLATFTVRP
ncbi:MAG TPA: Ig-like domain-containing protein [Candidatus Limnocylindrales bacterium]|nr:Ig-like domain-containing protein [Candidatus Limnocylindrales bacterium]